MFRRWSESRDQTRPSVSPITVHPLAMRIVFINLKRASERRARMAREFAALGLRCEVKEAIDGYQLSEEHLVQVEAVGAVGRW